MSKPAKLTPTMATALVETHVRGGVLERKPGGFWTVPGAKYLGVGVHYEWYLGTATVEALVTRGHFEYTAYQEGRNGRFPVAVKLVKQ